MLRFSVITIEILVVVLYTSSVTSESVEISSYSRVAKSGIKTDSNDKDGPQIHRAREGVVNSNLWFPHIFNETTSTSTTTTTTTTEPPSIDDASKEFSGRSSDDESRQFPPYQLSNSAYSGKQAINSPASSSGSWHTILNRRYDEKPMRQQPNYISYTPPPVNHRQQQQPGKPLGKNMASDRYTPGIAYYASLKAQKQSADFQKAQAQAQGQLNSGDLLKSPSQTVNYVQSPPQSMKYVPSKNLYSFPPNSDATYIPSSPGDLFQNPINSYSPPPAGPADNTPYSKFPAPPISQFVPTIIPSTQKSPIYMPPIPMKNGMLPNMDSTRPLILSQPQPKDLLPAASQMQASDPMAPPPSPDSMPPPDASMPSPSSDSMPPPDAMPSASPMPPSEMPSSDTIPSSGPSSHELLGIHDSPSGHDHDHHPHYLDYPPPDHDHDHFHGFPTGGDHDYGTHGIDTYPEVILDHDPHQDYFDHFHHPPPTMPPPTPPPPPPPPTMPPTTMPPPPPEETGRVKKYSYFYLGRKLWYIPLYFTVWFTFYVAWLIIQSIGRHKVDLPNHTVNRRSIYTNQPHKETVRKVDKATVFVMSQIEDFADKYL